MVTDSMELTGKNVLVVGTGISGIGAARLLYGKGACPVLFDEKENVSKEEIAGKLNGAQAALVTGTLPEKVLDGLSLAVLSPGVPSDTPFAESLRKRGLPVWGEIELAYHCEMGTLIGITGTNGKTTTTALTGQIMKDWFGAAHVVGNIGNPYTGEAALTTPSSVTVAEISSFQLETVDRFKPHISAILNITPDHLDRHHSMENYVAAKERIAKNQGPEDVCVLNYENEYTRAFGERCPARVVWFSSKRRLAEGLFLDGDRICMAGNIGASKETDRTGNTGVSKEAGIGRTGESAEAGITAEPGAQELLRLQDMHLVGLCNVENVMAAIAIGLQMQVPLPDILKTVKEFRAVEHRIEFVATKRGVDYYNDSKGTNPDAAIQGIRAMTKPTLLIAGGYDKHSSYDEWIEAFEGKVKWLLLIGQTAEQIEACARRHGMEHIHRADSLEEALGFCTQKAQPGDAVLLSPACASWGMFPNYEVRGKIFKDYVNGLKE